MTPDSVPPGGGIKRRIADNAQAQRRGSGSAGSNEAADEGGHLKGRTLRDMRGDRVGGSEKARPR